ncbi:MAG: ROK family protein [Spirochaetales bacterium]|nr:MAG: ROK family protein [Spirochaetales bacterium]
MEQNRLDADKIIGVGITVPGNVDKKHLMQEISPQLNVKKVSFLSLPKELRIPVYLEKEANAATLAELKLGIAKGMKNLVYIYLTQGVGAGMVMGGELYTGAHNRAGEIGHQTIIPKGKRCNCGKLGCWEMYISEEELLSMYRKKREGRDTSLKDFFNHLSYADEKALSVWEEYL